MKTLTPTAQVLVEKIKQILKDGEQKGNLVNENIQNILLEMTPNDIDSLKPPSISDGAVFTDDIKFNRRLTAFIFGVSDETINEIPCGLYPTLLQITSQNFLFFMANAIQL